MNTKQRRTARRKHLAKFGAQLVELRLLGVHQDVITQCREPSRHAEGLIGHYLAVYKEKRP